jgi:hypothetical protein
MAEPTSEQINTKIDRYMSLLEAELGNDIVPIVMILLCRVCVKYGLDIHWVIQTILMGYHNEVPPDIDLNEPVKYDS